VGTESGVAVDILGTITSSIGSGKASERCKCNGNILQVQAVEVPAPANCSWLDGLSCFSSYQRTIVSQGATGPNHCLKQSLMHNKWLVRVNYRYWFGLQVAGEPMLTKQALRIRFLQSFQEGTD
jgi:hypothetical protein